MKAPTQLDHVGIAVRSLARAMPLYRDVLGLELEGTETVASQQVRVALFKLGQTRIELLEPTADDSPIARFLARRGPGLHHLAYRVDDLPATLAALKAAGVRLVHQTPQDGGRSMQIAFAHPSATGGVLIEFCQRMR